MADVQINAEISEDEDTLLPLNSISKHDTTSFWELELERITRNKIDEYHDSALAENRI